MALIRLRESFSLRLAEETSLDESGTQAGARLLENNQEKLIESGGQKYEYIASYRVPISRFDWKNANGRIYPKKLWENVIKNQSGIWEGCVGLADHPGDTEDGSVKSIFGVWRNLGINEKTNLVEADLYLIGENGLLFQQVLEAGGKAGLSTSGYGELKEDKSTVDESSFQIERISDWVLNPSQNVFAEIGMKKKESISVKEKAEKAPDTGKPSRMWKCTKCGCDYDDASGKSPACCPDCSNKVNESTSRETIMDKKKLSKAEIRGFKENVEKYFNEATKIADPADRLDQLTEIRAYFDEFEEDTVPEVKAMVETRIAETKEEIAVAIKEHTHIKTTFGVVKAEELKEGVKRVSEDTLLFKRDSEEWKTIAQGLQEKVQKQQAILEARPTVDAYKTSLNFAKKLKEELDAKDALLEKVRVAMEEALKKEISNQKALQNEVAKLQSEKTALNETIVSLKETNSKLNKTLTAIKTKEAEKVALDKKRIEEKNKIDLIPKGKPNRQGFDESSEVLAYWKDISKTDGKSVAHLKEAILSSSTLKEAMRIRFNDFANTDIDVPRLSNAINEEDRKSILASRGIKLNESHNNIRNMPKTWE
jgi:hypothetical protein